MAINRIEPVGRVQKRIFSMVEILDKSNAPLQEIYDTVCSVVPAMADEDIYTWAYFLEGGMSLVKPFEI